MEDARAAKRGGGEIMIALEELEDCIPSDRSVEREIENAELEQVIDKFVRSLPYTERNVFICRYWYLDAISEICQQFGFSQSKVKSMLQGTRKNFKTIEKGRYGMMKTEKLLEAIGEINDKAIRDAKTHQDKHRTWVKWGPLAACLCLVAVAVFAGYNMYTSAPAGDGYAGEGGNLLDGNPNGYSVDEQALSFTMNK